MMVMPSNNSGIAIGRLCGMYPNRVGWLMSPDGFRRPLSWMPFAIDNGAFGAWVNKKSWDSKAFEIHVEKCAVKYRPLWCVVPDVVGEKDQTKKLWEIWEPKLRKRYPFLHLAFAVQDGMTELDVPESADVVFIGGTTEWKWKNLRIWTENFQRVHVGRVNSERLLWMCYDSHVESCDGTGWTRGGEERLKDLEKFLELTNKLDKRKQLNLENIL